MSTGYTRQGSRLRAGRALSRMSGWSKGRGGEGSAALLAGPSVASLRFVSSRLTSVPVEKWYRGDGWIEFARGLLSAMLSVSYV